VSRVPAADDELREAGADHVLRTFADDPFPLDEQR